MKNILPYVNIILLALLFFVLIFDKLKTPKNSIAYVRSIELMDAYHGMKEAREAYQIKLTGWQNVVDSLDAEYARIEKFYKEKIEDAQGESEAKQFQTEYYGLASSIHNQKEEIIQIQTETDDVMTKGVLNKVNQIIEDYAREKDYAMVIGTSDGNVVLYGDEGIDITDEVLSKLNKGK